MFRPMYSKQVFGILILIGFTLLKELTVMFYFLDENKICR